MSLAIPVYPVAAAPLSLQAAAQRAWFIRRLWRERALDRVAGLCALDVLAGHPNPRVRTLCQTIAREIVQSARGGSASVSGSAGAARCQGNTAADAREIQLSQERT